MGRKGYATANKCKLHCKYHCSLLAITRTRETSQPRPPSELEVKMPIVPYPHLAGFLYRQLLVIPPWPKTRFDDKTIIVTGSNIGLGLEAARHFGRLGAARVILAVRDLEKGEAAKKSIDRTLKRSPSSVTVWKLDLSSYESVAKFATRVEKELDRVDVVCANAGIATGVFRITEKDESTITTNVVSTFLLAFLLLPKLKETAQRFKTRPTLTITSSEVVSPRLCTPTTGSCPHYSLKRCIM
jgi:hypothetical protein